MSKGFRGPEGRLLLDQLSAAKDTLVLLTFESGHKLVYKWPHGVLHTTAFDFEKVPPNLERLAVR